MIDATHKRHKWLLWCTSTICLFALFVAMSIPTARGAAATGNRTALPQPGSDLPKSMAGSIDSSSSPESPPLVVTSDGSGYWLVASDGGIFSFGDAGYYGSTGATALNQAIVGMAPTPDGGGYWLVAKDGGIFSFGGSSRGYYGSTGGISLNKPIVGMAATPDGKGYWLVASDGGIFSFGDAGYYGSTGDISLNRPIVGMADTLSGKGYWLVASDGGVFTFGDAEYFGSEPGTGVDVTNIVGLTPNPNGHGYWIEGSDGKVDAFGDTFPLGSMLGNPLNKPIVGFAVDPSAQTPTTPLTIATPSLPIALVGANYSASLAVSGGISPYAWTIISGSLPNGLSLSSSGKITGVPNNSSNFTVTAQVVDGSTPIAQTASTTFSIDVSQASATAALSGPVFQTTNWSGYVAGSGPFTSVTGTFNVASVDSGTPNDALMTEWVGIDGWDGDNSLIQAGITEYSDPLEPDRFVIQPWWTILPAHAAEVNIPGMTVSAGDEVTVNIDQVGGTEWQIDLIDDTNGESFNTDQTYTGPGSTADWIVEAPSINGQIAPLAPYSPIVHFTDLRMSPVNTTAVGVNLVQSGARLRSPPRPPLRPTGSTWHTAMSPLRLRNVTPRTAKFG